MDSGFGQAYAAEWVNIFTTPGAPNPIGLDQATITSLRYRFSGTTDGGTPVREWQAQIASNGAFTQNVQTVGSNGTTVFSGLSGGTTYYARSRGRNDVGWGAWSSTISATTLPSGPPGITVSPSADGMAADVRLSPPGNATGVQEYQIDYRETGASSVTTISTTSPTKRVPGLTPGGSYDWRARARFGTYWSPYSTWQTVVQLSLIHI